MRGDDDASARRRRRRRAAFPTRTAFRSLSNRNYRLYFTGQCVSITGTWMQRISQSWLVLELTGSGQLLGLTVAVQALPFLIFGTMGGVVADRRDKRRLLIVTQAASGFLALALFVLFVSGVVTVWMVMVLAFALGTIMCLDNPARQSFVSEMVTREHLINAVTLNSIANNVGKAVGPALSGTVIAAAGTGSAFLINALSFGAVICALVAMNPDELTRSAPVSRNKGQIREGIRHAWDNPLLFVTLMLLLVSGLLASDLQVKLPLFAVDAFGGDAQSYGLLFSFVGMGSIFGGFAVAAWLAPTKRTLILTAITYGVVLVGSAMMPTYKSALVAMLALGVANIAFNATTNSMMQLEAAPEMRGRIMSLSGMVQRGTSPVSAPLSGSMAEFFGARFALGVGGVTTVLAAVVAALWLLRGRRGRPAEHEDNPAFRGQPGPPRPA